MSHKDQNRGFRCFGRESRLPRIVLISLIPEMQGEFSNTLVVEMGPDNASRIRVVE